MAKFIKGSDDSPAPSGNETALDQAPDLKDYATAKRAADEAREKHTFRTPKKFKRGPNDPGSITLVELTLQEEDLAYKLSRGNEKALADEMLKQAIYAVDERPLNRQVSEAELHLARWSARFRKLAYQAFGKLHNTSDEDDAAFLESEEIAV